jgi:hypothetical protein
MNSVKALLGYPARRSALLNGNGHRHAEAVTEMYLWALSDDETEGDRVSSWEA